VNEIRVRRRPSDIGLLLACLLGVSLAIGACHSGLPEPQPHEPQPRGPASTVVHPEWSYAAAIYEVNLRQYSPGGTFAEFEAHLPRLKKTGVGILWFMPIHPIGEVKRKGTLGSYYSVRDYYAVNPEFGTFEEFRALVDRIHAMGMHVLIDWVANHSAWDNPLTVEHPEWFTRDGAGNMSPPVADWSDVVDFNYENLAFWEYMIDAMKFWVREADVDGFRCDVAGMVPIEFWNAARTELEKIKPVFMLAEAESPGLHREAFDMTYGWRFYGILNAIAEGTNTVADIDAYLRNDARDYPPDAFRMYFTSNHDENSWNGTVYERLGGGVRPFAVLTLTIPGMPLIYSGQEAGLDERLAFFEKDLIEWRDHDMARLYTLLLNLKRDNRALWNGLRGGPLVRVPSSRNDALFAFIRERNGDRVFVAVNLTDEHLLATLQGAAFVGEYDDLFKRQPVALVEGVSLKMRPWGYRVLVRRADAR